MSTTSKTTPARRPAQNASSPSKVSANEFRHRSVAIASALLRDWVGEERAREATGRIATAISASAASARNPQDFYDCTPQSVAKVVAISALTGIMVSTGQAALAYAIPRRPRKGEPPQLQYQLSHRGIAALAKRAGLSLVAYPISTRDDVTTDEAGEIIVRSRDIDNPPQSEEDLRGVMVLVRSTETGTILSRGFVPKATINIRRDGSDSYVYAEKPGNDWAKESSPWHKWYVEMAIKGLSVDTPIPTPEGWTTMGELAVGDTVYAMDGELTTVVATSEVKHLECFEIEFADGETIVCDEEHHWFATIGTAGYRDRKNGWPVYSIAELFAAKEAGQIVSMPVAGAIYGHYADLPVAPWLLGYWLGNGSRSKASVTCDAMDAEHIQQCIAACGCTVGAVRSDRRSWAVSIGLRGVLDSFRATGVIGDKHIPTCYLRATHEQRLELLCGLMDSDGHVDKRGRCIYTSCDRRLAEQVHELACSLGQKASLRSGAGHGYGKDVTVHVVTWMPNIECVSLPRKRERLRERIKSLYRGVKAIRKVDSVPTRCISVDHPSKSYLASRSMIPTHNTAMHYAVGRGWCVIDDTEAVRALQVDMEGDYQPVSIEIGDDRTKTEALTESLVGSTTAIEHSESVPVFEKGKEIPAPESAELFSDGPV